MSQHSRSGARPARQVSASKQRPASGAKTRKPPARPLAKPKTRGATTRSTKPAQPDQQIPSILLEGDQPIAPPPTAVGSRPLPETAAPGPGPASGEGELPEAYGTGRLFLTPRDPRCVCAQWDLTAEQLRYHNRRAAGQHLVLRVYRERFGGERVSELHVHPESRHWFVHVEWPGAGYVSELGYYTAEGQWHSLAVSEPVATPVEAPPVIQEPVRFAKFEIESRPAPAQPSSPPAAPPQFWAPPGIPAPMVHPEPGALAAPPEAALPQFSVAGGQPEQPQPAPPQPISTHAEIKPAIRPRAPLPAEPVRLTLTQQEALWELAGLAVIRRQWLNSAELSELISGQRPRAISSAEAAQPGPGALPEVSISSAGLPLGEITSPGGAAPAPEKAFWFNINAELIIYGATEPDAQVTIGGRTIRLRPDGTFSYRFALPDGEYLLPIAAIAPQGDERRADLAFYRGTRYVGAVGAHPQDPELNPPAAQHIT